MEYTYACVYNLTSFFLRKLFSLGDFLNNTRTSLKKIRYDRDAEPGCSHWNQNNNDNNAVSSWSATDSQVTSNSSCTLFEFDGWQRTPGEVLVIIFKYLNDRDRCRASLACKGWRNIFFLPSLWHTKTFSFREKMTDKTLERYRSFLDQLGRHMRHMILEFDRSDPNDTANTFQNFVNEINAHPGLNIRSIRVRNRHLHSGRRSFSIFRGKVIRAFCTLLMEQVHVEAVDLSYCQINRYEGTRLLEALTYNTQHHAIGRLDIEGFFLPRDPVYKQTVVTNPKFSEVMGTFTALAHVCLNQVYMNEVVLEKLTTSSGSTLRTMELVTDPISFVHRPVIPASSWLAAVERCPQLKVSVRFIRPYFRQYNTVLVPNIPLSEVSVVSMWTIQDEDEDEFTADMLNGDLLFDHISNVFYRTIEKVQVFLQPKPNMLLDRALVQLIEKCHRLQNIFVDVTILPETVHQIMAVVSNSAREHWNMSVFVSELTRKDVDDLRMVWPAINTTVCQSADQDPQYDMCKIYLAKLKER